MAFKPVKQSAPESAPQTKTKVTKQDALGTAFKKLRMCPFDAEELEKTNEKGETYRTWPWVYLCTMFKKLKDGKYGAFTQVSGSTEVDEEDPERLQDRYEIRADKDTGNFVLRRTPGQRKKVFGDKPKGKDGCAFDAIGETEDVCTLAPVMKDGKPREGWYEGDDAKGNSWQVIPYQSKEDREKRKAGGGGGSDSLANFS